MYTAATPLQEALTRSVRRTLYLLWAGAGFVLLIGAINIANLSLARASARRRELATRLALGARPIPCGAAAHDRSAASPPRSAERRGSSLGAAILRGLAWAGWTTCRTPRTPGMDATTITFVAAVSVIVAMLIGLVPAMAAGAVTINQVLGEGSRFGTGGRSTRLFRRGLVVTQVALSVVLLIGGTLLLTSFRHLLNVDAWFTATGVVTAHDLSAALAVSGRAGGGRAARIASSIACARFRASRPPGSRRTSR